MAKNDLIVDGLRNALARDYTTRVHGAPQPLLGCWLVPPVCRVSGREDSGWRTALRGATYFV